MNSSCVPVKDSMPVSSGASASSSASPTSAPAASAPAPVVGVTATAPVKSPHRVRTLLVLPVAIAMALGVHHFLAPKELPADARSYFLFLEILLGTAVGAAVLYPFWRGLRRWMT